MSQDTFAYQAEVGRLLDIVAHSLYTHKEIFLRELISNASDACDRLRYAAITEPQLLDDDAPLAIRLVADSEQGTLSIVDNGIGMDRQDLIDTLGTIARSGTQAFLSQLTGDSRKDVSLIGQFGVGFYSAFMVADHVEVLTRRAGDDQAWRWSSDGRGSFTIADAERDGRGTTVTLHLKEGETSFLEKSRLRSVVKTYSDHIAFPILVGDEKLNSAQVLWTLPKKDITEEEYKEFYRHVAHAFDEPWMVLHNQVEGVVSYTSLLFVPSSPPFDLYDAQRKSHVRLYVKRVFITDDCEGLIPPYLRFLRGVVDSEDLPLNISRETFQHDPRLHKIRAGLVKRVLDELAKKADDAPEAYEAFWEEFGALLKEGVYEDFDNRERILKLARFRSTNGDGWTSLDAYLERMRLGQDAIYTLTGEEVEALRNSPQLEGFRAKGVEVLLLTDPIDEFWIPAVRSYLDRPFRSAADADADLGKIESVQTDGSDAAAAEAVADADLDRLIAALKSALGARVKDVRPSRRLTDSPVCLVTGEGEPDAYLERLLRRQRGAAGDVVTLRILEVNPGHPLIRQMAALASAGNDADRFGDAALLLLDQARILEGDRISEPAAFARRMTALMERSFGG